MANNKKIKILFIMASKEMGGSEKNLIEYLKRTDTDKFECFVGLAKVGNIVEDEFGKINIRLVKFDKKLKLLKFLMKENIDIIQLYGLRVNIWARLLGKLAGAKVVATIRSVDNWRKWYHVMLDRLTSMWVDVWISNSYAGKEVAIKREKFLADKIKVIHNGIDLSIYQRIPNNDIVVLKKKYGIKSNDIIVGEVANIRDMKGHIDIINAIPNIIKRNRNVKFFFAGEDMSNGEVEKYAKAKNVSEYVIFAGYCHNIVEILSLFDIFILPSLWEGLPNSIIEAMAIGLPIIASDVGGVSELIKDGENGILIKPKSPQQIASSIIYLIENPNIAEQMGNKNIIRARQNHNIENKARDYEKIYMELLEMNQLNED